MPCIKPTIMAFYIIFLVAPNLVGLGSYVCLFKLIVKQLNAENGYSGY